MLMTGNIVGFDLKELLQMLDSVKKGGCLSVNNEEKNGKILFSKGKVADVRIEGDMSLEQVLIGEGLISKESADKDGKDVLELKEPVGQRLSNQTAIKDVATRWYVDEIFSIFSWADTSYQFEAAEDDGPRGSGVEINVSDILRGIEKYEAEWNRIYDIIPSLNCQINLVETPKVDKEISLNLEEWRIILKLKDPLTIEDLKVELNCPLLSLCQQLVTLEARGLVDFFNDVDNKVKLLNNAINKKSINKYIKKDEDAALPLEWSSYYEQLDERSTDTSKVKVAN